MAEFDQLAELYDRTRGGEGRGDGYAADIHDHLPPGDGTILEIGVGTGVVALGLQRRGRRVIGVDISAPMLTRAIDRLGPSVMRSDGLALAIGDEHVDHAVSVWVVHAVPDPVQLFREARRVLRRGGFYIVCSVQRALDEIGRMIEEMGAEIDGRRHAARPRRVASEEVLAWSSEVGFTGSVYELPRSWVGSAADELDAIRSRAWPTMRDLDALVVEEITAPYLRALEALPQGPVVRRAMAEMVVLERR